MKLKAPGLRVRHRRGYRDKGPEERLEERLESALHLGLMSNPLAARLGAGTVEAKGNGRFSLPLHIMVPAGSVVFLAGDDDLARLTVRAIARDSRNRRVVSESKLYRVARPPADIDTLDLVLPLEVESGAFVLAVGLRDETTQETSYLSTTLSIQDPGGGR